MCAEIIGAVALAVEGIIFFLLQEPELVSKMGYIGKYFTELFRGWASLMSVASLIFLFLPILLPDKFKDSSAISARDVWILAAACFLAASFLIWLRAHRAVEEKEAQIESAKSPLPMIKGVLSNFRFGGTLPISVGNVNEGKWRIAGAANFDLYLCNHKPRETNLQKIELDGSCLTPPIEFGTPALIGQQSQNAVPGIVLADGKGVTLKNLLVSVQVYGFKDKSQVPPIDLTKLKVLAVDGFLTKHHLEVEDGEMLSFQSR